MAQGPIGVSDMTQFGTRTMLNITSPAVVKAAPGRLCEVIIQVAGTTSGAFTFNDCTTVAAASAANQVWTLPYNATANVPGYVAQVNFPCRVGIVCSAVPGGGTPNIAVSYA